ncbi:hypothetical protein INR49_003031 [Caranx melampygus]|nr:hypothetical protein INR49_003031 [Caranx melampygus]
MELVRWTGVVDCGPETSGSGLSLSTITKRPVLTVALASEMTGHSDTKDVLKNKIRCVQNKINHIPSAGGHKLYDEMRGTQRGRAPGAEEVSQKSGFSELSYDDEVNTFLLLSGVCCASLKDNKALMKMGLGLVLVGHVNFLLGALVHGAVLRHINVHSQARTMVFAISNIIAIVAGLIGIISGITAIVLSKNKKNRILQWVLLVFGFLAGLLALASFVGLSVSMATTIILWVPLIVMSVVEMVFSFRCFAASTSFLYLCPCRRKPIQAKRVRIQRRVETSPPPRDPDSTDEAEPAENEDLLEGGTAVEQTALASLDAEDLKLDGTGWTTAFTARTTGDNSDKRRMGFCGALD